MSESDALQSVRSVVLPGHQFVLSGADSMELDNGTAFGQFSLAYQTYGELNAEKSNAILVCHALTGDQYVAENHPVTGKPGWWAEMVGIGKPIDTDRFYVICINVLGGCMGSTGPQDIDPKTAESYGLKFPRLCRLCA
jgi:homoserine O-acetyltransferase